MAGETPETATASDATARPQTRHPTVPLRAPTADEAWRVEPIASAAPPIDTARLGSAEHLLVEPDGIGRRTLVASAALAVCVVAVVLVGMAVMSHGNGDHPASLPVTTVK